VSFRPNDRRRPSDIGRRGFLAGAAAVTAAGMPIVPAAAKPKTTDLEPMSIDVLAKPINGFSRLSGEKRFGRLVFRGGLTLSSSSEWFGGWSGVTLGNDGRRILAVSDAGVWLTAEMVYDGEKPVGVDGARIGPILASDGSHLSRNRDRDAEAVCLVDGSLERGTVIIAFEQNTRIGRFPVTERGVGRPTSYLSQPAERPRLQRNRSIEAVTVLRGGRYRGAVLAFAERYQETAGKHTGWLWLGGRPEKLFVSATEGYDITDVAGLRDGSILILERAFGWLSGVAMRLRIVTATEISPGRTAEGRILLTADMGSDIDNMEALAVHETASGETVVTLMSDDNFNAYLQRNLLLQFTLTDDKEART
jgi:hypothetical protein